MLDQELRVSEIILERIDLKTRAQIDLRLQTDVREHIDQIANKHVFEVRSIIAGDKKEVDINIEIPANWWEHFKQQYLTWLPVRTKHITKRVYAAKMFPDIHIPEQRSCFVVQVLDDK